MATKGMWPPSPPLPSLPPCVQAKGTWTKALLRQCQECVLMALISGVYQPPMRLGAFRVAINYISQGKATCPFEHCKHKECKANHISYYKDRHGYHGEFVMVHFKNEAMKGEQHLPISPKYLEMLTTLEKGIKAKQPRATTLFFSLDGPPYQLAYFSTIATNTISFGGHHLTANTLRHLFVTSWKDFTNTPTTKLYEMSVGQLNAAAADLMLNSTQAWASSYDDSNRVRGTLTVLSQWDAFTKWVEEDAKDKASKELVDPTTLKPSMLTPLGGPPPHPKPWAHKTATTPSVTATGVRAPSAKGGWLRA